MRVLKTKVRRWKQKLKKFGRVADYDDKRNSRVKTIVNKIRLD